MAGEFDFMKDLGFSPEDLKGKTKAEALSIIEKKAKDKRKTILEDTKKELFENAKSKFPDFKAKFSDMFHVYVKPLGASTKPTDILVVGYNPFAKEIFGMNGSKAVHVPETDLIKSDKEYNESTKAKKK